jgi:hypothetical protein
VPGPRPRDPIALAKLIGDIATGQVEDKVEDGKDPAASELGRIGGIKGGKARAERLSAEGPDLTERALTLANSGKSPTISMA